MWERVKRTIVESRREVCGSVRVEGKNTNSLWWNYERIAAVRRKEAAWKEVLAASHEEAKKKDVWKRTRREEEG